MAAPAAGAPNADADEKFLSEVHVGRGDGGGGISRFEFFAAPWRRDDDGDDASDDDDDDGDLVVKRKRRRRGSAVTIRHDVDTSLRDVGMQVRGR